MEFYWKKYQLPMLYLIGFGTGILYANFIAKNYVTMTGIFHEYFLNQYTQVKIINEDLLFTKIAIDKVSWDIFLIYISVLSHLSHRD